MPRPPLRLLIIVVLGWIAIRIFVLWPERQGVLAQLVHRSARIVASIVLPEAVPTGIGPVRRPGSYVAARNRTVPVNAADLRPSEIVATPTSAPGPEIASVVQGNSQSARPVALSQPPIEVAAPRWSGWAYVFARPGGGRSLASQGQIGGSQAAARIAYRIAGPLSLAVRAYAPLKELGAEAALGVDLALPVNAHVVIERRVGLDRAGRNAWSAYASSGFYRERHGVVTDGYAQSGVVGARRRDVFVDGAVRVGRRLTIADLPLVAGFGAWGAAQPGAARLDVGPRIAMQLPVASRTVALSFDGRIRIAGHARPGSGMALTLGTDF